MMPNETFPASPLDFKNELNAEQYAAVTAPDGPCLVLAGAGSGKTRVITFRVAHLISRGVAPEEILLLTFTNKAAAEMMSRIADLLAKHAPAHAGRAGRIMGGTFHSVANRLLREFATHVGHTPRFTILDEDDRKSLLKAVMRDMGFLESNKKFLSPAIVKDVLSYRINSMMPLPDVVARKYPKFEHLIADLQHVAEAYDARKRQADSMDFDDMLARFYELVSRHPDVCAELGRRYRHVLVDEYQDTNPLQAAIIRAITGGCGNVLVVGDDAQSIYSFRAADIRNILDFPKHYPGTQVFKLETNYRSTEDILDLANDVISHNRNQFPKELRSVVGRHEKPAVVPSASSAEEARFVASRIDKMLEDGLEPRDIAVLFRATHHSQALEFELLKLGIEYDYRGGVKFFDRAHVKDVVSFLRIAENFRDEAAWLRLLSLVKGIGDVTAGKIYRTVMSAGSVASALLSPIEESLGKRAAPGWVSIHACLEAIHKAEGKPGDLVRRIRQVFYEDYLDREYPDALDRRADIRVFEEFASGYASIGELLSEVTLDDSIFRSPADRRKAKNSNLNKVVLSTVHQAKGLEWAAVFVIHATDRGFPNARAAEEEDGIEEERRLFYVAVTRAKRFLCLSYPMTASFGDFSFETMSRFVAEAEPSLIDWTLYETRLGGISGNPYAASQKRPANFDEDGFYEEDAVSVDTDAAPVDDSWKKKSFLGKY